MKQNYSDKSSRKIRKRASPGTAPGFLHIAEDALRPQIQVISYADGHHSVSNINSVPGLLEITQKFPHQTHWIDIRGLGDSALLSDLADKFSIHKLEMEDVVNTYQRPKIETYDSHLFFISRMIFVNETGEMLNEQLALFLGPNYLITIQETYDDVLNPVRNRIEHGKGYIRHGGASYLAYAVMDSVVDHYYPILEIMGEQLENLDEELIEKPSREKMLIVQQTKRQLITLRRAIWPEREKMSELLRSESAFINEEHKLYYRDCYDHCVQVLDLVESYKEMTASLMDIYLSSLSNRMNQIMKVLAIIATIFIPLSFIAGLYGMNFVREYPDGTPLPWNMPELYSPYGYPVVVAVMVIVVIVQLYMFYRKGWLSKD